MANLKDDKKLYFIGLIPNQEVSNKVMELKNYMADHHNCKAPLRSPPHITLYMPFQWKENKALELSLKLQEFADEQRSFEIHLKDFDSFSPRVIYIIIEENEFLQKLKKNLNWFLKRNFQLMDGDYKRRGFSPHITIAFRDLRKSEYFKAWEKFEHENFDGIFKCDNISLLKHTGKKWEIHSKLYFGK